MRRTIFLSFILCTLGWMSTSWTAELAQPTTQEIRFPNPNHLQPQWWDALTRSKKLSVKTSDEFIALLSSFVEETPEGGEKERVERLVDRITILVESLLLLQSYSLEEPPISWIPKESYNLDAFLELHDQAQNLQLEIELETTELERQQFFTKEYRQSMNNDYIAYTFLPSPSIEKFFAGLELIAKRIRLQYFELEKNLTQQYLRFRKDLLERYREEIEYATQHLQLQALDSEQLERTKETLSEKFFEYDRNLLLLESELIRGYGKDREAAKLITQKILQVLAQEALLQANIAFIDAKMLLAEIVQDVKEEIPLETVEEWQNFHDTLYEKLMIWKRVADAEIGSTGKGILSLSATQEEDSTKREIYQERNQTALNTMVILDELSRQLFHLQQVLDLINATILAKETWWDKMIFHIQHFFLQVKGFYSHWLYYPLFEIGAIPVTLAALVKALFILIIAFLISKGARRLILRIMKKREKGTESPLYILSRVVHYGILFVGLLFALATLGLQANNIAIILGALGVGIGFGLQNIVNNFLSGLTILFGKSMQVGDYIELESGHFGKITEVKVQSLTLHTFDGTDIIVPNSYILGNRITNWTKRDPYQRLHIPFCVPHGTDQEVVQNLICKIAENSKYTIKHIPRIPKPEVWLVNFGESALDFELVVWINIYKARGKNAMKAIYLAAIEKALKENGIHIPFPQRDLHVKTVSATTPLPIDLSKK